MQFSVFPHPACRASCFVCELKRFQVIHKEKKKGGGFPRPSPKSKLVETASSLSSAAPWPPTNLHPTSLAATTPQNSHRLYLRQEQLLSHVPTPRAPCSLIRRRRQRGEKSRAGTIRDFMEMDVGVTSVGVTLGFLSFVLRQINEGKPDFGTDMVIGRLLY